MNLSHCKKALKKIWEDIPSLFAIYVLQLMITVNLKTGKLCMGARQEI